MQCVQPRPTSLPRPSDAELHERQTRALESALRAGFDGLIVWGRGATNVDGCADLLYLTNHISTVSHIPDSDAHRGRGHAALVLVPGRDPVLVTDAYDIDPSIVGVSDIRMSTYVDRDTARVALESGLGGRKIGLAGQTGLLHSAAVCMSQELGGTTSLVPADFILTALRLVKSPHEIELLKDASRIGCEWMQVVLDAAQPGRTEGEVAGEGLRWFAASGGWAYDVAISSGPWAHRYRHRQALPTWDSTRRIEAGDLLHVDLWGPAAHGYYCDLTRSIVVGKKPTDPQRKLLEDAVQLVETVIETVEPGRKLSDLYAAGVRCMERRGGGGSAFSAMVPFFGHSLGLECESPFITESAHEIIVPDMVLAIECFLGEGDGRGAGFEHVIHVREDRVDILTDGVAPRPWLA
ncbi:Xaa-Pro peptidase family protein [Paraburkholderia fungorum]|uniref:Peptidase M24 domain-containing protein n=1 Tax=Paraburkholderia fungorum TaxID=134537 RepID=A0A420GT04_9BURK|nr:M24 family metallopeptidase [Paraburkholderia fungorum]RKF48322.1 hypothetical protein BCY88_21570 [Paraburkholderia fungorum]